MKSCLVRLDKGSKAKIEDNIVTIQDFVLTPNGMTDTKLVCIIFAKKENGNMISATSDRFFPLDDEEYEEFYPTPHMFKLK